MFKAIGRLLTEYKCLWLTGLPSRYGFKKAAALQYYEAATKQIGASTELFWSLVDLDGQTPYDAHRISVEYYVNRYIKECEYDTEDCFFSFGPGSYREYPSGNQPG